MSLPPKAELIPAQPLEDIQEGTSQNKNTLDKKPYVPDDARGRSLPWQGDDS